MIATNRFYSPYRASFKSHGWDVTGWQAPAHVTIMAFVMSSSSFVETISGMHQCVFNKNPTDVRIDGLLMNHY